MRSPRGSSPGGYAPRGHAGGLSCLLSFLSNVMNTKMLIFDTTLKFGEKHERLSHAHILCRNVVCGPTQRIAKVELLTLVIRNGNFVSDLQPDSIQLFTLSMQGATPTIILLPNTLPFLLRAFFACSLDW